MNPTIPPLAIRHFLRLLAGLLLLPALHANSLHELRCRWCAMADSAFAALAADATPGSPKYSPSREVDILHLALDITPDFSQRTIAGIASVRFKPIARPLPELSLDAEEMDIDAVHATEPVRTWHYDDHRLVITFDTPLPADRDVTVTIRYRTEPRLGLYFRTPEMGYRPEDTHLWTQGEPTESRHWFPCFDAPNEKFTSEITCRVPEGMVVRSNGRLVSSTPDPATGLVAVRWLQDKPHVTYLLCLVAGHFKGIEDQHRDIPLGFWTPVSQAAWARNSFRDTRAMMEFFERELGVPFPWAKYDQVVVDDYTWGGMENTSITILTDRTLFPDGHDPVRSSRGLVAHELAHQWFGDLVTCRDWSHLWLNEGFATYYDALQAREQLGRDEFLGQMFANARSVLATTDGTPIVWRNYSKPVEQFGYRAYPKGAWVLHMLRSQLGEDLFRRCVTTYLQRHAYGVVETSDLQKVIEELSGLSFDRFFDQWLHHGHHPELDVQYSWDATTRLARISVAQKQKLGPQVMLFDFPLPIRFVTPSGVVNRTLRIHEASADFQIPLPEAPDLVRIDPEFTVLAKVTFDPPKAMLTRQLAATNDPIGRLLAVQALSTKRDVASVGQLQKTLGNDPFHLVRSEAADALRSIHSPEAFAAHRHPLIRGQVALDFAPSIPPKPSPPSPIPSNNPIPASASPSSRPSAASITTTSDPSAHAFSTPTRIPKSNSPPSDSSPIPPSPTALHNWSPGSTPIPSAKASLKPPSIPSVASKIPPWCPNCSGSSAIVPLNSPPTSSAPASRPSPGSPVMPTTDPMSANSSSHASMIPASPSAAPPLTASESSVIPRPSR